MPRSTVTVKDVEEVSILVSVVRAYDVPVRRELDKGSISHMFLWSSVLDVIFQSQKFTMLLRDWLMVIQSTAGGVIVGGSVDSLGAAACAVVGSGAAEAVVQSYVEARFQVPTHQ